MDGLVTQLWVDDTKPAPFGMEVARTFDEGLKRLLEGGVDRLFLDWDLGRLGDTGPILLETLVLRGGDLPDEIRGISSSSNCNREIRQTVERLREIVAKRNQTQTPHPEGEAAAVNTQSNNLTREPQVGIEPTTARSQDSSPWPQSNTTL